jgi:hypothetical protein
MQYCSDNDEKGFPMLRSRLLSTAIAGALIAATTAVTIVPADAQWRGRHHHHHRGGGRGGGGAVLGGLAAGAILGGAIAASRPPAYYYGPGYYDPPPYAGPTRDEVAYCMSRFKSYDPRSGTYLGYDGYRHPCP